MGKRGNTGLYGDKKGKTGPKRSEYQREQDKITMMKMIYRGYTLTRIAHELGVSPAQITHDYKDVVGRLNSDRSGNTKELITSICTQLDEVKKESWEAWENSKLSAKIDTVDENGNVVETITKIKDPDPAYLNSVLKCLSHEREMLGLDAPKEMKGNISIGGQASFDEIMSAISQKASAQNIEEKILQIEATPVPVESRVEVNSNGDGASS